MGLSRIITTCLFTLRTKSLTNFRQIPFIIHRILSELLKTLSKYLLILYMNYKIRRNRNQPAIVQIIEISPRGLVYQTQYKSTTSQSTLSHVELHDELLGDFDHHAFRMKLPSWCLEHCQSSLPAVLIITTIWGISWSLWDMRHSCGQFDSLFRDNHLL